MTAPPTDYLHDVRRVAVRRQRKDGTWEYAVVISTLTVGEVLAGTGQPPEAARGHRAVTLAYVRFYDARGGGVETAIKDNKQGLGLMKRRFAAQQLLVLLGTLAHNVLV